MIFKYFVYLSPPTTQITFYLYHKEFYGKIKTLIQRFKVDKIKATVVYVEDEDGIREPITTFLKRRFETVFVGANGKEGLELIQKHNPDVVVTDLQMPIMNGLEMIEKIRQKDYKNHIIVTTAYMDDEHHTDLASVYIRKPIVVHNLVEKIKELLNK